MEAMRIILKHPDYRVAACATPESHRSVAPVIQTKLHCAHADIG